MELLMLLCLQHVKSQTTCLSDVVWNLLPAAANISVTF